MHLYSLSFWSKRYYKQGYDEGFADGLKSGPAEGFEFGHEIAFQKLLPLGILLGRCVAWKESLLSGSPQPVTLSEPKKARAIRQIELLETMILSMDIENESEADHGRFETMKNKIITKSRVIESLMREERKQLDYVKDPEDFIALAKRMDRELQM